MTSIFDTVKWLKHFEIHNISNHYLFFFPSYLSCSETCFEISTFNLLTTTLARYCLIQFNIWNCSCKWLVKLTMVKVSIQPRKIQSYRCKYFIKKRLTFSSQVLVDSLRSFWLANNWALIFSNSCFSCSASD